MAAKCMPHTPRAILSSSLDWRVFFTKRRLLAAIVLCMVVLTTVFWPSAPLLPVDLEPPRPRLRTEEPPTWEWLLDYERRLPQHNHNLSPPDGKAARYVRFNNQAQGLGWNNVLSELLMNAHLAHESGRGFVFPYFEWEGKHYPWKFYDDEKAERQWPPHTPLNALLSGPIAGGNWDWDDETPRSITNAWFDVVCPVSERYLLNTSDVKRGIEWVDGSDIFAKWAKTLRDIPDRCVEIMPSSEDQFPQTFDLWLWGSARLLSLWESFSTSPVSRLLGSSPIVRGAVERNEYLFLPRGPRPSVKASHSNYDRVLAIHIRRGDYEGSCKHFATWSSTFYGWNQLDFLPDHFTPPPGSTWGENTPENIAIYMQRCLPGIDDVVDKVRVAREQYEGVADVMYVLTNEKGEWLERLLEALKADGWSTIRTSRDLVTENIEQKEVAMAIDMEVARRAAVFVGNGWSSFTSSIVHRRLVDGKDPSSIRFY